MCYYHTIKPIEYTDALLEERTTQLEEDYKRIYPDGNVNVPLYEMLQYHKYLCEKRGLKLNK